MLEAAARFEPEREVRFSTYATWWIRASIQDYILRNWSIVRGGTSSAQKALFFNLRRLRAKLSREGGPESNASMFQTIALAIGVSPADVELMDTRLSGPDVSLNAPVADTDSSGQTERVEFLVDDKPLPDETVGEQIDGDRRIVWLREALGVLTERELAHRARAAPRRGCRDAGSRWARGSASRRSASARSRTAPWKSYAAPSPTATKPMPPGRNWP